MVGLAGFMKQPADLFGGGGHLLPVVEGLGRWVQVLSLSHARPTTSNVDPNRPSARTRAAANSDAHRRDGRAYRCELAGHTASGALLGLVTDRLDVVAIRVADERPVIGGVVLRPQPRLV